MRFRANIVFEISKFRCNALHRYSTNIDLRSACTQLAKSPPRFKENDPRSSIPRSFSQRSWAQHVSTSRQWTAAFRMRTKTIRAPEFDLSSACALLAKSPPLPICIYYWKIYYYKEMLRSKLKLKFSILIHRILVYMQCIFVCVCVRVN